MKKIMLIIMLFISATYVSAVIQSYPDENATLETTYTIESPIVKITQLKYEPYPVEPGSYFTMWVRVDNIADEDAENVVVEVIDRYPFTIDGVRTKTIGKLGRRQSAVLYFERIRVDEKAIEGDNPLEFRINMGGGYQKEYTTQTLYVKVQTVEPLLSITVSSQPEKIPQGGISNVSIELQNMDTSSLKNINLDLVLPSSFIPVGSTSQKKVQQLSAGEKSTINYDVMALADTEANAYQIELDVSYSDEIGTRFSKNETIGLMVGAEPALNLNLEKSDTFTAGKTGKVTVSVSNIGPSKVKFLTVEVLPSDDYTVLSNSESYLGNLDPDDFETAEFTVYANKKGDVPLKIKLNYKDSYNTEKNDYGDVNLKVYSSGEIRKYGLGTGGTGTLTYIIYLVIAIFAIISLVQWRKEKSIRKAMKNAVRIMILAVVNFFRALRWSNLKRLPRKIKLFLQQ
jgi:hypothetical protein